jgi:hypothetical protein
MSDRRQDTLQACEHSLSVFAVTWSESPATGHIFTLLLERETMMRSALFVFLLLSLQLHSLAAARPAGVQKLLKAAPQHQHLTGGKLPGPTGEDDEKDWNKRPIIGILTQVIIGTVGASLQSPTAPVWGSHQSCTW